MPVRVVDDAGVAEEARRLVAGAELSLDVASPWIRGGPLERLLRARRPGVAARVLFRVKEPEDLDITDLGALLGHARRGVALRYSRRLHAKAIVVDRRAAIVSSSNLTEAAGFGYYEPARRNRELGVVIEDEPQALAAIVERFEQAWGEAEWLDDGVVGVVMDFPSDKSFYVACSAMPVPGSYVVAQDPTGSRLLGRVTGVTAYNRTFPRMTAGMWATQGYRVAPDAGGYQYELADLQTLFSAADKERGVLGVVAALDGASLFHVAGVEVLAGLGEAETAPPRAPAVPGTLVRRAGPDDLAVLTGVGSIGLGTLWHHPEVSVGAVADEILTRHLAILGMTGSGKSNALLVLVRRLMQARPDLRVVLVDTHGEYRSLPGAQIIAARLRADVSSMAALKPLLGLAREDRHLLEAVVRACERSNDVLGFADELEVIAAAADAAWVQPARRLAALCRERPAEFCLGGPEVVLSPGWRVGLNVLDVSTVEGIEERARVVGAALADVYCRGVREEGVWLAAIDEAQNYVPEQQTGLLSRTRPSFDAAFRIASEGRKFGVGLIIASQRPARVNKDVLSQCNSHLIFRLANVEDLQAVAGCFETAGRKLLDDLPGLPVGVCLAGGTAFGMPVRVQMPRAADPVSTAPRHGGGAGNGL